MPHSAVHPVPVRITNSPFPEVPVPAELRFDPALPYAACLAFPVAGAEGVDDLRVCWYFGRDLLDEGRHAPVGDGDVQVAPGGSGQVRITLQALAERVVLAAPGDLVAAFLTDSFASVPAGRESQHLDLDAALTEILATG